MLNYTGNYSLNIQEQSKCVNLILHKNVLNSRVNTGAYLVRKSIPHLFHVLDCVAQSSWLVYQTLRRRVVLFQPFQECPSIAQHLFQSAGHLQQLTAPISRNEANANKLVTYRFVRGWMKKWRSRWCCSLANRRFNAATSVVPSGKVYTLFNQINWVLYINK